jgi:hypothetical protein
VLGVLGVVLIIVAVMYFTKTANALPSFFPGHEAGKYGMRHHHTKHGILALVLGILALIGAWITAGRRSTS